MTHIPYALLSEREKNAVFVQRVREMGFEPIEAYESNDGVYLKTTTDCFSVCAKRDGPPLVRVDGIPDDARPVRLFG